MKIIRKMRRCLYRKVLEGTLTSESDLGTFLNCRGEWGQNLPAKFWIKKTEGRKENECNEREKKRTRMGSGGAGHPKSEQEKSAKSQPHKSPVNKTLFRIILLLKKQISGFHQGKIVQVCKMT